MDRVKLFIRWILLLLYITISLYGRDIPAYVTAWPKQVQVEKPDPVLGDKLVWEHWIYSEKFAKRFDGFSIEQADPELQDSPIQAIVLRIYKKNHWIGVNDNFPEQYATDIDLYFDDIIQIPLSQKTWIYSKSDDYPKNIQASFMELKPVNKNDIEMLQIVKPIDIFLKKPIVAFAVPLDGRFRAFGNAYYPHLLEGMSFLTLKSRILGGVAVPLQTGGSLWLSLFGERSYKNIIIDTSHALIGSYNDKNETFQPDPYPETQGFVRLPKTFTEIALPKMALIKDLNRCIAAQYSHENPVATSEKATQAYNEFSKWCEDTKRNGIIFNPSDYLFQRPKRNGLFEIGF